MSVVHGKPYAQCPTCRKWVRAAGFLAGWHLCLTDEEAQQQRFLAAQAEYQHRAQMASLKGSPLENAIGRAIGRMLSDRSATNPGTPFPPHGGGPFGAGDPSSRSMPS